MFPSKMVMLLENFLAIVLENIDSFEKIVKWKNIQNLNSYKECYIHFCGLTPVSLRNCHPSPSQNKFSRMFWKIWLSSKKIALRENIQNHIPAKKVIFIFITWCPYPFPSKMVIPSKNDFSQLFQINIAFFEKIIVRENIQNHISCKNGYIHFFVVWGPFP